VKTVETILVGYYDYRLVCLSIVIAICASYAALDLAGRVTAASGRSRNVWLLGGATAMGLGIWSMHYIGMLAFSLHVPVQYDWPTVLASLFAAICSSVVTLFVVSRLEEETGLSRRMLIYARTGRRRPHPNHQKLIVEALRRLGVI
jgi:NO-binding membrane sensor protein with MHYT domain